MASVDAATVLSSLANFESLVAQLITADNTARQQAEALYDHVKGYPDQCVTMLVHVMKQSQDIAHRSFCAVMLRKVTDGRKRALPGSWSTPLASLYHNSGFLFGTGDDDRRADCLSEVQRKHQGTPPLLKPAAFSQNAAFSTIVVHKSASNS